MEKNKASTIEVQDIVYIDRRELPVLDKGDGVISDRREIESIDSIKTMIEYRSEMQEIISAPPPWLVRWGMTVLFLILSMLLGASAIIKYPDIIRTSLIIKSENVPKSVLSKKNGRVIKLLKKDNTVVKAGEMLAFMESTGNHEHILTLLDRLKSLQYQLYSNENVLDGFINAPGTFQLGELQRDYMDFYQFYLRYKTIIADGSSIKHRFFLQREIQLVLAQKENLLRQRQLQEQAYELAVQEYEIIKKLYDQKVVAIIELKREEGKLLASQQPLQQTQSSLISNNVAYSEKEKELMDFDQQISEIKSSFFQALNNLISSVERWKVENVLIAPQTGTLTYAAFLQENQHVKVDQEIYYVNTSNNDFFGSMSITEENISKVRKGQKVLIRLRGFPHEEYGIVHGQIASITEVPVKDSFFLSRADFSLKKSKLRKSILLKAGMTADAEIITQDATLLRRLLRGAIRIIE